MAVYGLAGVPGMILGGLWGDAILRRRRDGRMLLAALRHRSVRATDVSRAARPRRKTCWSSACCSARAAP